jgi:hypothetical protein
LLKIDGRGFVGHRMILESSSGWYHRYFKSGRVSEVWLPEWIGAEVYGMVHGYFYTQKVDSEYFSAGHGDLLKRIINLLRVARFLEVEKLIKYAIYKLMGVFTIEDIFLISASLKNVEGACQEDSTKEMCYLVTGLVYEYFSNNSEAYFSNYKDGGFLGLGKGKNNFGLDRKALLRLAEKTVLNLRSDESMRNLLEFVCKSLKTDGVGPDGRGGEGAQANIFELLQIFAVDSETKYFN